MKLCRYDDNRFGVVRDGMVHDVTAALDALPALRYPFPMGDMLIARLDQLRPSMEALADETPGTPADGLRFLSPVANPTKIIGTPQNYEAHARETLADTGISQGRPRRSIEDQGLFLKANSALIGPSEGVAVRFPDRRTDHEAELGVIIGRTGTDIAPGNALDYVAGYAIAMDMVVRGPEDRSFRKSVDSYAILGPWLVTADEFGRPEDHNFCLTVNGEVRQKANTSQMIIDTAHQIAWASQFYTLYPGDIIMSGTCEGVQRVQPGDRMHLEFDGIGAIDVDIRAHG
jgi:2-keto-4-pentenoate hydratase/2-oxohepta-3-ene-1,7-dioic acid hydratase in catechol pathway